MKVSLLTISILSRIVTGGKKLVPLHEKNEWLSLNTRATSYARVAVHLYKTMLSVWWDKCNIMSVGRQSQLMWENILLIVCISLVTQMRMQKNCLLPHKNAMNLLFNLITENYKFQKRHFVFLLASTIHTLLQVFIFSNFYFVLFFQLLTFNYKRITHLYIIF